MALGWRDQYTRYRGYFLNIVNLYKQRADLRAFVEVIFSIATITIFLVFALKPTALTIIALIGQINEKKATVTSLDQKISDLAQASIVYNQNQSLIALTDTAVSNSPQPDTFAKQVYGIATKDSVKIVGISIGEVALVGTVKINTPPSTLKSLPENALEMPVSINAQGDFASLTTFLKDIEGMRIVTKIDQVGINSSQSSGQTVIVELISGRVPYIGK